jgi:hypothetical protein
MLFYRNVSDRDANNSHLQASHPESYVQNVQNKFSPKTGLNQEMIYPNQSSAGAVGGVQHAFPGSSNNFQAFNNKLKQKKQMMGQFPQQNQMLNARSVGGLSNFMQSYNQNQLNMQQNNQDTYSYSIPSEAPGAVFLPK